MLGLMATSSKRAYAIPKSVAPGAPAPAAVHCWSMPPQETPKHSSGSVSGSWCAEGYIWALWASLAGMGFDSKCDFTPSAVVLELLLCPWTWAISSELLQPWRSCCPSPDHLAGASLPLDMGYLLTVTSAPSSWRGVFPHQEVDNWDIQGQGDLLTFL